jgi:hypothetical protein
MMEEEKRKARKRAAVGMAVLGLIAAVWLAIEYMGQRRAIRLPSKPPVDFRELRSLELGSTVAKDILVPGDISKDELIAVNLYLCYPYHAREELPRIEIRYMDAKRPAVVVGRYELNPLTGDERLWLRGERIR